MVSGIIGCSNATPSVGPVPKSTATVTATPEPTIEGGSGLCSAITEDLAVAALGGPVEDPAAGIVSGQTAIFCNYESASDSGHVHVYLESTSRADCEDTAHFLGLNTPTSGVGDVAYHMDRSKMGDEDAFVLAWANGLCTKVFVKSDREQSVLFEAADAIAASALEWSP